MGIKIFIFVMDLLVIYFGQVGKALLEINSVLPKCNSCEPLIGEMGSSNNSGLWTSDGLKNSMYTIFLSTK